MKPCFYPLSHMRASRVAIAVMICLAVDQAQAASLVLANTPLFLTSSSKANVLMMMGNSNSMDEDTTGAAALPSGSASASSKSEIARNAIKTLISNYTNAINMGLMAYQQNVPSLYYLHNSQYDPSYDPADYNAAQATSTVGSINSGSSALTVVSTAGLTSGGPIVITGAGAVGNTGCAGVVSNNLCTKINTIVGTTVTLASVAGTTIANTPVYMGRNAKTKAFRITNPTTPANYIYYNVDAPYYASASQGIGFAVSSTACTSPTKDFYGVSPACTVRETSNLGGDPCTAGNGPWDSYLIFGGKTSTSNSVPTGNNATATAAGYTGYSGSGGFCPTDSDVGQGITDFGVFLDWQYVSRAWFSNTSPGMGYVHVPIALLDSTQATKLNTKLGTTILTGSDQRYTATAPLQNSGLSPLQGTLLTSNYYFNGNLTGTPSSPQPSPQTAAAQGGPLSGPPNSCGKNFLVMLTDGLPSVDLNGTPVANVTTSLADLQTQAGNLLTSTAKVKTYIVGFALPYGVNPAQLNSIAVSGGTTQSYYANDTVTLNSAFSTIFSDIINQTAAASSVALSSQSLGAGSALFQAKFSSFDWSGQLLSLPINPTTGALGPATWDAGSVLNSQSPASRVILTYKPSAAVGAQGIPFRWPVTPAAPSATELDISQSTALNTSPGGLLDGNGSARLDFLRGSAANEGSAGLHFRARVTSKLGDLVDSAPTLVAVPPYNYNETSYASFRTAHQTRTSIVYVGGNDGMLHGFNSANGQEVLAYVPSGVYSNLSQLTSPTYTHRYYVDGSPSVGDVVYGGNWHTVLASSMGNGARGIFALDVTDPRTFNDAHAANIVNFEFTDSADTDVGYVSGPISIVKLNNGKWAAVFGNGYNSTGTGTATLFVVDIQTGALIKKISTGVGSVGTPNALANPIIIDTDGNQTADIVYAGDLQGNLWKFDISSSNPSSWAVAYKLYAAGQPITTTPEVGKHPMGGYLVYFGTGKYLETTDIPTTAVNKVYGVWDNGAAVSSGIVAQTVTGTPVILGQNFRTVSQNAVNWASDKGWSITLPTSGERMVADPTLHNGRLIFTSMIPSTASCSYGGTSWLMELDYLSGGMLTTPPLDTNGDGVINGSDTTVAGAGLDTIGSAPAIQGPGGNTGNPEIKFMNESNGSIDTLKESTQNIKYRRVAWRQIQ